MENSIKANISVVSANLFSIIFAPNFSKELATEYIDGMLLTANNVSCFYIVALFTAQMLVKTPFKLLWPLRLWNLFLAVFSMFGMMSVAPELWSVIGEHGLKASYCNGLGYSSHPVAGRWMFLFTISKFVELGDTMFRVLRKKPVNFDHWFHHSATLLFTFCVYTHVDQFGAARWGTFLNFLVHSLMYSYFFLTTWPELSKRMPPFLPMFITIMQIGQFIIVNLILLHLGILVYLQNENCDFHPDVFVASLFMFGIFLYCFISLFENKYLAKKKEKKN